MKQFLSRVLLLGLLSACQTTQRPSPSNINITTQSQKTQFQFIKSGQLPQKIAEPILKQVQTYADKVSRRRQIDLFQIHNQAIGLQLDSETYLLSFLGTAKTRNDLNVEVRALVHQEKSDLNLNYSGPVTRQLKSQSSTMENQNTKTQSNWEFELITGLPGEGVVNSYEKFMTAKAEYLRYRYQAQPFEFDNGPLVYALHKSGQVQGFAFMNQRNYMVLGSRKYADVQSVVVIDPQTRIKGAYTLVAFNPKTENTDTPNYKYSEHERFGHIAQTGTL